MFYAKAFCGTIIRSRLDHLGARRFALAGAVCILYCITATALAAQTLISLAVFSDGGGLYSSLIQGTDGSLYGTSQTGGAHQSGTVFKVTTTGTVTTLHAFCSATNCGDGAYPIGGLVLGTDGNFYGTTQNGGTAGMGTIFSITPAGTLSVLHSFAGPEGAFPDAGLVQGSDGNLYGTAASGGLGDGTVFRYSFAGAVTTLHSFNYTDGYQPIAPLIQGTDGNFYGTTNKGGIGQSCAGPCGTVFKITPGGNFTSLHSFKVTEGNFIAAPLVQATTGAFYGTAFAGGFVTFQGCPSGCGTVFKISSGGAFSTIHQFMFSDGGASTSALVQATDGNLYGESPYGGAGYGEIFKLVLPNHLSTATDFSTLFRNGGFTAVLQATNGKFYGTYGYTPGGTGVFSYDIGLPPFVSFVSPTAKIGGSAEILGQGLTGTTAVTFNGRSASSFRVVSDTYLTATVPTGSTGGPAVVTTPSGTLTSNVNFRILR